MGSVILLCNMSNLKLRFYAFMLDFGRKTHQNIDVNHINIKLILVSLPDFGRKNPQNTDVNRLNIKLKFNPSKSPWNV